MKTNYEQKITRQSDSTNSCEDELKNKKWQKTTTGSMFQSSYYACIFILFFVPFILFYRKLSGKNMPRSRRK